LKALETDVALDDAEDLRNLALSSTIALEPAGDGNRVLLDGRDVSQRVREADVTVAASRVSVHPRVRQVMVARQRALGTKGGVVMEGRDIGTAVFPNADVKVFLDADPNVRAERRLRQTASTSPRDARRLRSEIAARDERDRTRRSSPLVPADDAVVLDTTHMNIDDVVAAVYQLVQQKLEVKSPA
jgi:cytidylate kinase